MVKEGKEEKQSAMNPLTSMTSIVTTHQTVEEGQVQSKTRSAVAYPNRRRHKRAKAHKDAPLVPLGTRICHERYELLELVGVPSSTLTYPRSDLAATDRSSRRGPSSRWAERRGGDRGRASSWPSS